MRNFTLLYCNQSTGAIVLPLFPCLFSLRFFSLLDFLSFGVCHSFAPVWVRLPYDHESEGVAYISNNRVRSFLLVTYYYDEQTKNNHQGTTYIQ